ncbi:hypothetical protein [Aneurinibacillus tyrosinisolvens]|uniref:hypothetical protein n=1 Tax=Aneurinibacillus tyrosinisolvens TaxID=1443435 RepID=UPI0006995745|nr:hypothetical protein [Aneurinibacillus tyrosinisolvens]
MGMEDKQSRKGKRHRREKEKNRFVSRWNFIIALWTFCTATSISLISDILLRDSTLLISLLTLFSIIVVGATADIVAVAITAASSEMSPFNSMAARKVYGAKQCIQILKNAAKYNTFFADVVGDVLGYLSGFAGALIVGRLIFMSNALSPYERAVSVLVAGLTSASVVFSKSIGKNIALHYRIEIVLLIGRVLTFIKEPVSLKKIKG